MTRRRKKRFLSSLVVALLLGCFGVAAAPLVLPGHHAERPDAPSIVAPPAEASAASGPTIAPGRGVEPPPAVADPTIVSSTLPGAPVKKKPVPAKAPGKPHFTILQIGDSHTAADFFSGRVRMQLQKLSGPGGLYLPPGVPHAGIRSDVVSINVTPGWEYQSMAKSPAKDRFWLTGYSAAATQADAEISFTSKKPVSFDAIDVSFLRQPGAGSADISIDGTIVDKVALDGPAGEPLIHRLLPYGRTDSFRKLSIRTTSAAPVALTGVLVDQRVSGVSYISVGFPGATANILTQLSAKNLTDDIKRIGPDMIVLAFGTNEGFDDNLDIARYRNTFGGIIRTLKSARPDAEIVVVGPPAGARKISCTDASDESGPVGRNADHCWVTPKNLDAVRDAQKDVATAEGAIFWDWSQTLPDAADLRAGRRGDPLLFGPDRIHLTRTGYEKTADAFASFLTPYVKKGLAAH